MVDLNKGTLLNQMQQTKKPTEQERTAALEKIKALPYGPLVLHAGANKLEEAAAQIVASISLGEAPKGLVDHADTAVHNLVVTANGLRDLAGPIDDGAGVVSEMGTIAAPAATDGKAIANEVKP